MPDIAGFRAKIAMLIPSTNTIVESDFWSLAIPGVTFHSGRLYIPQPALDSDAAFEALLVSVEAALETALRDVLTCSPDYLIMGMSAPTFWGGAEGSARFSERLRAASGLQVSTGAESTAEALRQLGARRIAVFTPYQPIMRERIVKFFEESDFEVVRSHDLMCTSATAIADVTPAEVRAVIKQLDGDDVDAIVQIGTNLSMLKVAGEAQSWLAKPVIANNAASVWHAYRSQGFTDKLYGVGTLFEQF